MPGPSRRYPAVRVSWPTGCVATVFALLAISSAARADVDPITALLARTDAVTKEVVKLRGLRLKRPLDREVVDRAELRRRLLALADEPTERAAIAAEGVALARWGLIPRGTDYLSLMVELLTDNVAGYYDSKTKKLTVSRAAIDDPAWSELVLAHEIDHGLQDQAFGLEKLQTVPADAADAALARRALIEGDGVALMIELALARQNIDPPWTDPAVAHELGVAMGAPPGDALDRAPFAVRERILFPYRSGLAFVAALRQYEPWSAVDAVFKRPPRSTEQILHVEKYIADEKPVEIALAAPAGLADYATLHTTVWGEHGFSLFLRAHGVSAEMAAQAATGWAGDRAIVIARPDDARPSRTIGLARLTWDTEADAIEAHDASVRAIDDTMFGTVVEHATNYTRWLAVDGTVSSVERSGDTVTIAVGIPAPLASVTAQANK
jgi:hypothetical protein